MERKECPDCKGNGGKLVNKSEKMGYPPYEKWEFYRHFEECKNCQGDGYIDEKPANAGVKDWMNSIEDDDEE